MTDFEGELAWAAGFFDGEGCTYFKKNDRALSITISQNNAGVLKRFQRAVGEGHVHGPYLYKYRPNTFYSFSSDGSKALKILEKLWPYLSPVKCMQALAAKDKVTESKR